MGETTRKDSRVGVFPDEHQSGPEIEQENGRHIRVTARDRASSAKMFSAQFP